MVKTGDFLEQVVMNNPRHTPEARTAWTAAAAAMFVWQAFFQSMRTRNPAKLETLLSAVMDWAKANLEVWPIQIVNPNNPGDTTTPPEYAGMTCPDGRPVGSDPGAELVVRGMPGYTSSACKGRDLYEAWKRSAANAGGDYPTGHSFRETCEQFARKVFEQGPPKDANTATFDPAGVPGGQAIADAMSKLMGVPVQYGGHVHLPKSPDPAGKKGKKKNKKRRK
jgi:hypothetical protein